jgi:hypothetical protein
MGNALINWSRTRIALVAKNYFQDRNERHKRKRAEYCVQNIEKDV